MAAPDSKVASDQLRQLPKGFRKLRQVGRAINPEEVVQIQVTHFNRDKGERHLKRTGSKTITIYSLSLEKALRLIAQATRRRRERAKKGSVVPLRE